MIRLISFSLLALLLTACAGSGGKKSQSDAANAGGVPVEKAYAYAQKPLQNKRYAEALPLLELAVKHTEVTAEQWANLGLAYSRTGEYAEALKALNKALQLAPGNADVLVEVALAHREQGEFDQARQAYEQALASNPAHALANYNLGILCDLYKQDLDCATRHYQQYLSTSGADEKKVKIWLKDLAKRKQRAAGGGK